MADDRPANYPDRHDQDRSDRVPLKEQKGYQTPQDQGHQWQRPPKEQPKDKE
jgi:hypothetical protein